MCFLFTSRSIPVFRFPPLLALVSGESASSNRKNAGEMIPRSLRQGYFLLQSAQLSPVDGLMQSSDIFGKAIFLCVSPSSRLCGLNQTSRSQEDTPSWSFIKPRLGLTLSGDTIPAYLVTPALFMGPLYVRYLQGELPFKCWTFKDVRDTFFTWMGFRNFVVVRPSVLDVLTSIQLFLRPGTGY